MAKKKTRIPKHIAGMKIKKRQRKQLKALVAHIDRIEELLAAGTALLAVLGIGGKLAGKGDLRDHKDKHERGLEPAPATAH